MSILFTLNAQTVLAQFISVLAELSSLSATIFNLEESENFGLVKYMPVICTSIKRNFLFNHGSKIEHCL